MSGLKAKVAKEASAVHSNPSVAETCQNDQKSWRDTVFLTQLRKQCRAHLRGPASQHYREVLILLWAALLINLGLFRLKGASSPILRLCSRPAHHPCMCLLAGRGVWWHLRDPALSSSRCPFVASTPGALYNFILSHDHVVLKKQKLKLS